MNDKKRNITKVYGARVLVEVLNPEALKIEDEPDELEPLPGGVPGEVSGAMIQQIRRSAMFNPKPMPPLTGRVVLIGDGCPRENIAEIDDGAPGLLLDERGSGDPSNPANVFLKGFEKLFEQKMAQAAPPVVGEGDLVLCWPYDGIVIDLPDYENMRLINVERIIARLE